MNTFQAMKTSTLNISASNLLEHSKCIFSHDDTEIPTDVTNLGSEKTIDISSLCSSELVLLKKNDPFMYYSIPGVREETLTSRELDLTDLNLHETKSRPLNDDDDQSQPCLQRSNTHSLVRRRSRISCEIHFGLVIDDMMKLYSPSKKKQRSAQCLHIEDPQCLNSQFNNISFCGVSSSVQDGKSC